MVQWLCFCAPNAESQGSIPGQGTKNSANYMVQARKNIYNKSIGA